MEEGEGFEELHVRIANESSRLLGIGQRLSRAWHAAHNSPATGAGSPSSPQALCLPFGWAPPPDQCLQGTVAVGMAFLRNNQSLQVYSAVKDFASLYQDRAQTQPPLVVGCTMDIPGRGGMLCTFFEEVFQCPVQAVLRGLSALH